MDSPAGNVLGTLVVVLVIFFIIFLIFRDWFVGIGR